MSVKHIKEYYDKVCDDYIAMKQEIKEFEEEAQKGLVPPQALDNLKEVIKPLMANYETLSWVMYLLNQPNKPEKKKKYKKQNEKLAKQYGNRRTPEKVLEEDKKVLNRIKEIV